MTWLMIGMFLMPCALSDGASTVYTDNCDKPLPYTLKTQRDMRAETGMSGLPTDNGRFYAAQTRQQTDRNGQKVPDAPAVNGSKGKKAGETKQKLDPVYLDIYQQQPLTEPASKQIFRQAHNVWGGEGRMMEMLSGIAYTEASAKRDGVESKPYVSSLHDVEALKMSDSVKNAQRK